MFTNIYRAIVSYTNADGVVYNSPLSTTIYLVVSNPPVTTVLVTRQYTTNNAYIFIHIKITINKINFF